FHECIRLTSLDVSGFDTSRVTNMSGMFLYCQSLTSLDVSGFDTSKVTDMGYMFYNCSRLTSLDLSGWNTSSVTNMGSMFALCSGLTSLDLTGWDTSSVTDMSYMFESCGGLTSLDLSRWNTSSVKNMRDMFHNCYSLTSLDLSGWNTSSVTDMSEMFNNCSKLTSLDLSGFDTSSVTDMTLMFSYSSKLTTIFVSNLWSATHVSGWEMFYGCKALVGGRGTVYDESRTNANYAHVDGGSSNPGYFTYKAAPTSGGGGSNVTAMLASPARGLMLEAAEAAQIDLVTNSTMYDGDGDSSEVFDQWIDNGNGTWTYRFHVYEGEATYYIYESALAGFECDHGANNYITLDYVPGEVNTAVITNTKKVDNNGSLTIRKTVTGVPTSQSFNFTIKFDQSISLYYGDASDVKLINGEGSFTLKNGESVTITGLPVGVGYTVTETDSKGYTASVNGTVGTELTSNITVDPVVTFVNHKDPEPEPEPEPDPEVGSLKVSKTVALADGVEIGKDEGRRFSFTVTLTGADIPTGAVNFGGRVFRDGKTSFTLGDGESVTLTGIPAGTHYVVTETTPEGFELTKSGDVGTIVKDETAEASFTNTKTVNDKSGGFTLAKKLGTGTTGDEAFTFYVELNGLEPNVTYTYGDGNSFTAPATGKVQLTV
ncbi:MAG: BspA family leucine-rich repeat surface protein, partial [Oscillospiraceae bacterium]|nr:BspA family leucine-rich repeat surface protein [Oscillospiraceae bacterium]